MRFDEQHNGDQVDLGPGVEFEVSLTEQPTTGFRWRVDATGEPACRLCDDKFHASASPPGGGGTRVLRFQTVQPGLGVIELAYRRSWDTTAAPARQFVLRVRVASS